MHSDIISIWIACNSYFSTDHEQTSLRSHLANLFSSIYLYGQLVSVEKKLRWWGISSQTLIWIKKMEAGWIVMLLSKEWMKRRTRDAMGNKKKGRELYSHPPTLLTGAWPSRSCSGFRESKWWTKNNRVNVTPIFWWSTLFPLDPKPAGVGRSLLIDFKSFRSGF